MIERANDRNDSLPTAALELRPVAEPAVVGESQDEWIEVNLTRRESYCHGGYSTRGQGAQLSLYTYDPEQPELQRCSVPPNQVKPIYGESRMPHVSLATGEEEPWDFVQSPTTNKLY